MARSRRLLIVEDEVRLRRSMSRYLERCGLQVTEAGSVGEAHRHLDAGDFDAVVIDVGLPDGDGLTLLARTDALHSVVVTANPDPARFEGCGVIRYLAKPLDLCELRSAIDAASRVDPTASLLAPVESVAQCGSVGARRRRHAPSPSEEV